MRRTRRRRRRRWAWRRSLALLALAGLGALALGVRPWPAGTLRPGGVAFAHLTYDASFWHLAEAAALVEGGRVALRDVDGDLDPVEPLPAGHEVAVEVLLRGPRWLAWWPGDRARLRAVVPTPPDPALADPLVQVLAGQAVPLRLRAPAAAVVVEGSPSVAARVLQAKTPATAFALPPQPAGAGVLAVRTAAAPWVQPSRARPLCWVAIPAHTVLGLQELLAELGYLPLRWSPRQACRVGPAAAFSWRWTTVPRSLRALWRPGAYTMLVQGAVVQFERVHHLPIAWWPPRGFWKALVRAWEQGARDPDPYAYVEVRERLPETLTVWQDGRVVLRTLVNTGRAPDLTAVGTFPVYLRLAQQAMRGIGPDGRPYSYPSVRWISYFYQGEAVHAFPRRRYGFPQSAGCVEVPPAVAETVWHLIHDGTLVHVAPA